MALKYCGGCRAQYDRVGAVNAIKKRLGSEVEFVSAGSQQVQLLLVVNGCATACATVDSATDVPIQFIGSPEDAENAFAHAFQTVTLKLPDCRKDS